MFESPSKERGLQQAGVWAAQASGGEQSGQGAKALEVAENLVYVRNRQGKRD